MRKIITIILSFLIVLLFVGVCCEDIIDMKIISKIESNHNPLAYNLKTKAVGQYQITQICLEEFNKYNKKNYTLLSLFNPKRNYEVAHWYLEKRIPEMLSYYNYSITLENTLICYNAGISYVVYNKKLPEETKNYIRKYNIIKKE
jgi:soluble lytic murein transglycosylase-like protein